MGLVSELRRRNVFRMAVLYIVAAWLVMQVAEVVTGLAELPGWIGKAILALLAIGFPIALILSWIYELTPEGINLEKDALAAASTTPVSLTMNAPSSAANSRIVSKKSSAWMLRLLRGWPSPGLSTSCRRYGDSSSPPPKTKTVPNGRPSRPSPLSRRAIAIKRASSLLTEADNASRARRFEPNLLH